MDAACPAALSTLRARCWRRRVGMAEKIKEEEVTRMLRLAYPRPGEHFDLVATANAQETLRRWAAGTPDIFEPEGLIETVRYAVSFFPP